MFIYERRDAQAHPWQAHQIFPFNTDKLICDISMIFKRRFQKNLKHTCGYRKGPVAFEKTCLWTPIPKILMDGFLE